MRSSQGTSGKSGYSGYSGKSGYSGYSAVSGSSGFSGLSGAGGGSSGYSGFSSAVSGASGYSGYSGLGGGASGYSGKSGYSGRSGFSASGDSGFSGYSAPNLLVFRTHTDVDYTLVMGDANTGIKMNSSAARNLIVPPNSSVAFPVGTQIIIEQFGTGAVSIVAGSGVILQRAAPSPSGQYTVVYLIKQDINTWLVIR